MRKQWVRVVLGAGCFIAVGANAAVNAQSWTLVDIGTLGGPGSYGAAVSDSGFVVGCADLASGVSHAFSMTARCTTWALAEEIPTATAARSR